MAMWNGAVVRILKVPPPERDHSVASRSEGGWVKRRAVKAGAELLFDVVGRVYERTRLIGNTNLPFEQ